MYNAIDSVDHIIDQATTLLKNVEITDLDDTITLTTDSIVFGKVKGHFTTDGHFIGWGVNCLFKSELCSILYPREWECNKMITKVFSTKSDALTELIKLYSRGFNLINREESCSH